MSVFEIPASYGPYIDSHVPGVIEAYNTDTTSVAGEIGSWDENVSGSINSSYAYARAFFQELMDKVNEGVSQLRADITEVRRLKQKRWQDASNSFNWAGSSGPGFGWDSFTNAVEGIWNNDKAREDHANAAVREGGYDAEIARLQRIKTHLDVSVRADVQSAINKANEVLDKANAMAPLVLRLAELNSGYAWAAFRIGIYKQRLTEFRDNAGETDLTQALNLDTIQTELSNVLVKIVDGEIALANPGDEGAMTMPQTAALLHEQSLTVADIEGNQRIDEESLIPNREHVGAVPVASPIANGESPQYFENSEPYRQALFGDTEGVEDEIFSAYRDFAAAHPNSTEDFGEYMMARYDDGQLSAELRNAIEEYSSGSTDYVTLNASTFFNLWKSLLVTTS